MNIEPIRNGRIREFRVSILIEHENSR